MTKMPLNVEIRNKKDTLTDLRENKIKNKQKKTFTKISEITKERNHNKNQKIFIRKL